MSEPFDDLWKNEKVRALWNEATPEERDRMNSTALKVLAFIPYGGGWDLVNSVAAVLMIAAKVDEKKE